MDKHLEKDLSTEQRILEASKRVFVRKGFDGARMQEIADEAGINKALLHYYFRSKEKLFDAVFDAAFRTLIPLVTEVLKSDLSADEKVQAFVKHYTDFLLSNPSLPIFILTELQRNPARIRDKIFSSDTRVSEIIRQIRKLPSQRKEGEMPIEHLFIDLLSLTIFPIVARPLLQSVFFSEDQEVYDAFLQERSAHIRELLKPNFPSTLIPD